MLRVISAALRATTRAVTSAPPIRSTECSIPLLLKKPDVFGVRLQPQTKHFSLLCKTLLNPTTLNKNATLFRPTESPNNLSIDGPLSSAPVRTVTKYSRYMGKRASVKTVLHRFYRLNWGMWIRTKAGRHKHMWKKTPQRKARLRRHVFTTASQSHLLDVMVTKFWRQRKYYVDDPYEPYHSRNSFYLTRNIPRIP